MGEMAEYALEQVIDTEALRDDYIQGRMTDGEAFDHGFIDSQGVQDIGMEDAWNRNPIPTKSSLQYQQNEAIHNLLISSESLSPEGMLHKQSLINKVRKNPELVKLVNLMKEHPTCNCCSETMISRTGKFGKFYFCPNQCEEQTTVGDKYWQSVRLTDNKLAKYNITRESANQMIEAYT